MPIYRINTPGPSYLQEFDDHYAAVRWAEDCFTLKRGWKIVRDEQMIDRAGKKHRATFVRVMNSKGKQQTGCVVYNTAPAEATPVYNTFFGNEMVVCRACNGVQFYELGRSRWANNFVCATPGCGAHAQTMTETGMSE